jgi:hypothetical protein
MQAVYVLCRIEDIHYILKREMGREGHLYDDTGYFRENVEAGQFGVQEGSTGALWEGM